MKKALIYSLFILLALSGKAQINLEHTFHSITWQTVPFITAEGICYYYVNYSTHQMTIYNPDYSVRSTIELTVPSGHEILYLVYVSDKLFNTNNSIEFLLVTVAYSPDVDRTMRLYDEHNTLLKDFGDRHAVYVITGDNESKLIVSSVVYNELTPTEEITDEIYSLPGTIPNGFQESDPMNALVYPNPSGTLVSLPYTLNGMQQSTMHIYNLNGQLIDHKTIDSSFNRIQLNVDDYLPGIYIYEYNGISKRFVVAK